MAAPADYFVKPHSKEEIAGVLRTCREYAIPYFILGNGSNLLVGDLGYRGVVVLIFKNYCDMEADGTDLKVQAGALMSRVSRKALEQDLAGMEFASGIPGTIGGAVFMNAGAYGSEMKDVLKEVTVLDDQLALRADFGRRIAAGIPNQQCGQKWMAGAGGCAVFEKGRPRSDSAVHG